jgi:hypothetical protein
LSGTLHQPLLLLWLKYCKLQQMNDGGRKMPRKHVRVLKACSKV